MHLSSRRSGTLCPIASRKSETARSSFGEYQSSSELPRIRVVVLCPEVSEIGSKISPSEQEVDSGSIQHRGSPPVVFPVAQRRHVLSPGCSAAEPWGNAPSIASSPARRDDMNLADFSSMRVIENQEPVMSHSVVGGWPQPVCRKIETLSSERAQDAFGPDITATEFWVLGLDLRLRGLTCQAEGGSTSLSGRNCLLPGLKK